MLPSSPELTFAGDILDVNKAKLGPANGRIIDVDVADQSTKRARFNILQQAARRCSPKRTKPPSRSFT